MAFKNTIPGPKVESIFGHTFDFVRNPLTFLMNLQKHYGDISRFKLNFKNYYFLTNPDHIQNFLVRDYAQFDKSTTFVKLRKAIGNGLLTCPFADHKRQRRLVQPAFTLSSLEAYGMQIPDIARSHMQRWNNRQTIDMTAEMDQLILTISARVLFGDDLGPETEKLEREIEQFHRSFTPTKMMLSSFLPAGLAAHLQGFSKARGYFEQITKGLIKKGTASGFSGKNLLSVMLRSATENGVPPTLVLQELTSQIINMILASVETVASTLNWTTYLLSLDKTIQQELQDEIDNVLGGKAPTIDRLSELPYTEAVIKESMRLFPAGWVMSRRAMNDYPIGENIIPKGSIVTVSPFVTQRDPRFFENPLVFNPLRWMSDEVKNRPEFSYFPFGGGPRSCIGAGFAMMEMKLILAAIAQSWDLTMASHQKVELHPLVTLRPKKHLLMEVRARRAVCRQEVRYECH